MMYRDLELGSRSSWGEEMMEMVNGVLKIEALRKALFVTMVLVAVVLTFCEPAGNSQHWLRDLLLTKAGAIIAWYAVRFLGRHREL